MKKFDKLKKKPMNETRKINEMNTHRLVGSVNPSPYGCVSVSASFT